MKTDRSTRKLVTTSLLTALLVIFSLLGSLPVLSTVAFAVGPIIVALIYVRGGKTNLIISFIAALILLSMFMNPVYGIIMALLHYVLGMGLTYMIAAKKGPLANFMVLTFAAALAVVVMFVIEIQFLTEESFIGYIAFFVEDLKRVVPQVIDQYEALGLQVEGNPALDYIKTLTVERVLILLPSILLFYAMMAATFIYKISQVIFKRLGIEVNPMPRLSEIKANMFLIFGGLTMAMLGILIVSLGNVYGEALMTFGNNIFSVTGIIGGLSLLSYFMEVKLKYPTIFRLIILALLFTSNLIVIIGFMGVVDSAFDFRKLTENGLYMLIRERKEQN